MENAKLLPNALLQGYFLMEKSSGAGIRYRSIEYFQSKDELLKYIKQEYEGTVGEVVAAYSITDLLKGQKYGMEQRQGTRTVYMHILLVHGTNLERLYKFLDSTKVEDMEGNRLFLFNYIKACETPDEISEIISTFNDFQDNYW